MIDHPIDKVLWIETHKLKANNYNPNVVATPELNLIKHNIMTLGFYQPILISPEYEIVDGYHRWRLVRDDQELRDLCLGAIPCVILDIEPAEAMMTTIRANRAKGTHVAVRMSDIVRSLHHDHGLTEQQIMKGCGMTKEEVELLLAGSLLKTRDLSNYRYSKAWVPIETKKSQPEQQFEREE